MSAYRDLLEEARRWPSPEGPTPSAPPSDLITRLAEALEATAEAVAEVETQWGVRVTNSVDSSVTNPVDSSVAYYWRDEFGSRYTRETAQQDAQHLFLPDYKPTVVSRIVTRGVPVEAS